MDKIRVLLADDHTIVREGIRALLARRKDIQVVGEASDGKQALERVAALRPDIVLMDIAMPEMDGLQATKRIRQSFPETRVLILTQCDNREYIMPLLRAGAAGYLVKLVRMSELVDAIRAVHAGGIYIPPGIARQLVNGLTQPDHSDMRSVLSEREKEVLRLIACGETSRGIAECLNISVRTVDTHRANIMEKTGVHSTAELTMYAIREGIVRL